MTFNAKIGVFKDFLDDFGLQHTFQERIESKSLQIDQYNLHLKFSTLNINLDSIDTKWPAHKGIKDGTP